MNNNANVSESTIHQLNACHQQTLSKLTALTELVTDHFNKSGTPISHHSDWIAVSSPMRQALSSWNHEINIASDLHNSDSVSPDQSTLLTTAILRHKNLLLEQQQNLRSLSLQIQHSINRSNADQRRSLLELKRQPHLKSNPDSKTAHSLATETTAALQRMTQLMNIELDKSTTNLTSLDSQTRLLRNVNQEHSSLTAAIRGARSLISDLETRDRTDKLIIAFACLVFTSVVFYILKKRVFGFLIPDFFGDELKIDPSDEIFIDL